MGRIISYRRHPCLHIREAWDCNSWIQDFSTGKAVKSLKTVPKEESLYVAYFVL